MIRLALAVGWAMTGGGCIGDVARRLVLPRVRLIPGLRDKVVDSTTPALRSSALVGGSRRLADTLCPNPLLPNGQWLDDAGRRRPAFALRVQPDDGRATITGIRTWCKTALLTEPSSMPVKPPRP